MKITTIWTIPAMSITERLRRTGDAFVQGIAHRLPRRLAYWSFIDSGVRAIGNDVVPDARYMDLLQRLEGGPR